jgi:hypothetical protein
MAKEKDIIEKIVKVITEYFNSTNSSEGEYWDADEQTFEYKIKFKPIEMLINKNKGDFYTLESCSYEGYIKLKVTSLMVGFPEDGEWEQMYGEDDIPEYVWDMEKEKIEDEIYDMLPNICIRTEFILH